MHIKAQGGIDIYRMPVALHFALGKSLLPLISVQSYPHRQIRLLGGKKMMNVHAAISRSSIHLQYNKTNNVIYFDWPKYNVNA